MSRACYANKQILVYWEVLLAQRGALTCFLRFYWPIFGLIPILDIFMNWSLPILAFDLPITFTLPLQGKSNFLAAQSSYRSLVVCPSVRCVMFVKKWPLKYQKVIKTYLPTYLWDSSDGSDSPDSFDRSDSSDSSDSSDRSDSRDNSDSSDPKLFSTKNFFHKKTFFPQNFFCSFSSSWK